MPTPCLPPILFSCWMRGTRDLFRLRRGEGGDGHGGEDVVGRFGPGVLEDAALDARSPEVAVDAVGLGLRDRHGDAVLPGIGDFGVPGRQVPLPDGGDDPERRIEGHDGDVEADLVVALARRAVGDGPGAVAVGGPDEVLGDEGAPEGRGEEVFSLVDGTGLQGRQDIALGELFPQVLDDGPDGSRGEGLLPDGLHVLALTQVGDEGDDPVAVILGEPLDDDGSIETSRVGENDGLVLRCTLFHSALLHGSTPRSLRGAEEVFRQQRLLQVHAVFSLVEDY